MRLSHIIRKGFTCFELDTQPFHSDEPEGNRERQIMAVKKRVIRELSGLFAAGGTIANQNKLFLDLWNREKRASTAVGQGIAIPHVRSLQARELSMGFARSTAGLPFSAPDGQPVHLFISIIGPREEQATYLRIYRRIAELFRYPAVHQSLMAATEEWEVLRALDGHLTN
jgi:mannitol/fructose-specific phosphotransferase system IIA component (Ntr-type)